MSSQGNPSNFGPPFDDPADMFVRSEDGVHFCVYELFMSKASKVFQSLLSPPDTLSSAGGSVDARFVPKGVSLTSSDAGPVLCLPETSGVVHTFLSIIISPMLPSPPPIPDSLEDGILVLAMAKTYHVPYVSSYIRSQRRRAINNPFHAFALAWEHRLNQEALAAVCVIASSKLFTVDSVGENLKLLTGPCLHELVRCRKPVVDAMNASLRQIRESVTIQDWGQRYYSGSNSKCRPMGNRKLPQWLDSYIESSTGKAVTQVQFFHYFVRHCEGKCRHCCGVPHWAVQDLWVELEKEMLHYLLNIEDLLLFDDDPGLASGPKLEPNMSPNNAPSADVILRSTDSVDFRMHKDILAMASPFFKDMFKLPQSPSTSSRVPIMMPEESETISHLVAAMYPITSTPDNVDSTMALLAALQKYGMGSEVAVDGHFAVIRQQLSKQLLPRFVEEDPCRTYALAVRYRLKEEAALAAQAHLANPMTFESCGDNMRVLPDGLALLDHAEYHARCRDAAKAALFAGLAAQQNSVWFQPSRSRLLTGHEGNTASGAPLGLHRAIFVHDCTAQRRAVDGLGPAPTMPGWLAAHFESMLVQLGKEGLPLSTDMRAAMSSSCSFALTAHLNGSPTFCVNCAATYAESRDALWNSVAEHMNEAIRKVSFEFSW